MDSESNKKIKCESDEELANLRASKVIKFVQIRDHESSGEIEDVEQIAPLQQRYVICRGNSPQPKAKLRCFVRTNKNPQSVFDIELYTAAGLRNNLPRYLVIIHLL
ncbi:unnamed protein product [Trichobilharzia regenti]|nr:unnamed protein product [Trichobilharzia regenti]